ncbi:hypothetical protein E3O19_10300 [Cryobacterium algoritolerans]|uniref:Uncharacterized protein n=1 Tax=Cryobacterium algoritolerans TaxID=1259184 RepID=A0A4V3IEV1_9MICO|nr:hypothetical protein E3O19_10300 [Cryobacterium algoritolerans]
MPQQKPFQLRPTLDDVVAQNRRIEHCGIDRVWKFRPHGVPNMRGGNHMRYRTLGNSEAVISTLALGTMTLGDEATFGRNRPVTRRRDREGHSNYKANWPLKIFPGSPDGAELSRPSQT